MCLRQFCGASMNNLPIVEDVVEKNKFIYDLEFEAGDFVGELARRSIGKYENTVRTLRYHNHSFMSLFSKTSSKSFDAYLAINFSAKQTT